MKSTAVAIVLAIVSSFAQAQIKLIPISEQEVPSIRLHTFRGNMYAGSNDMLLVSNGSCKKIDLKTGQETTIATGFAPKTDYFPMDAKGTYFFEVSYLTGKKIHRHTGKKLELVADIDAELKKNGYPPLQFYDLTTSQLSSKSDAYSFSFQSQDSTDLNGNRPFFNYPAMGLFNTKTGKLSFIGKQVAPSNKTVYYAGTYTYNDQDRQRILVTSVDKATIFAYNTAGQLIGQTSLPDSIKNTFRTIDQIPAFKFKGEKFHDVARNLSRFKKGDYYRVEDVCRLNDQFIGLGLTDGTQTFYLVFDNDLKFKGYVEQPDPLYDFGYYEGANSIFIHKYENRIKTVKIQ